MSGQSGRRSRSSRRRFDRKMATNEVGIGIAVGADTGADEAGGNAACVGEGAVCFGAAWLARPFSPLRPFGTALFGTRPDLVRDNRDDDGGSVAAIVTLCMFVST